MADQTSRNDTSMTRRLDAGLHAAEARVLSRQWPTARSPSRFDLQR